MPAPGSNTSDRRVGDQLRLRQQWHPPLRRYQHGAGGPPLRHRAGQQGADRPGHPRAHHRGARTDQRQLHRAIRHRSRHPVARRRPARPADRRRRTHRRARNWAQTPSAPAPSRSSVGFLLVVAFMGIFYGLFGWFANIALVINLILMLAILSLAGSHADLARHGRHPAHAWAWRWTPTSSSTSASARKSGNDRKPVAAHGKRLPPRLRHHHRQQRDRLPGPCDAVRLRLRPRARGFAVTITVGIVTTHVHHNRASHGMLMVRWYSAAAAPPLLPV